MATAPHSYTRAVASAALQAAVSGAWIAARELSPAKRRLARFGTVAAVAAIGYVVSSESPEAGEKPEAADFDRRQAAALGLGVVAGTAGIVGRRQLEKRWLARLTRDGHPHPTRALAVRMTAAHFALHLALKLADLHKDRSGR